jgi:hypothetical protein
MYALKTWSLDLKPFNHHKRFANLVSSVCSFYPTVFFTATVFFAPTVFNSLYTSILKVLITPGLIS